MDGHDQPSANGSTKSIAPSDPNAAVAASSLQSLNSCRPWHFLIDGALSYGCSSINYAPDAHFKFHAASVLCFCVSKLLGFWQQLRFKDRNQQRQLQPQQQQHVAKVEQEEDLEREESREVQDVEEPQQQPVLISQQLQPALLLPDTLELLMGLIWANLDEPLAQTARQVRHVYDMDYCRLGSLAPHGISVPSIL